MIPYVNLSMKNTDIKYRVLKKIDKVLDSGIFILGEEVKTFEERFARYIGSNYAIGVNSGTDALILALKVFGIGNGDEVITAPNSFLATASSIVLSGAKPVFVDVDSDQNINVSLIEEKISKRTKAIIPVHLTGRPADMHAILKIANKYNLIVIEDCAQAINAKIKNKKVGTFGQIGCFSLHPLKNLGASGDAGIIVTNDQQIYEYIKQLRNHGLKNRDECVEWSINSRLDEIQAAILNVKFDYLDQWTERRREIANMYINGLKGLPIKLPVEKENTQSVYHAFVIQTKYRDQLMNYLSKRGIETKIHYPIPIHKQQAALKSNLSIDIFPQSEKQVKEILSLPIYPELRDADVNEVIKTIRNFFKEERVF
ncbi:DegT/DnrJ/EryC1/StrS family aminotransferase [Tepidibacillus infernus]|uniref:DegT/DnrJ/EryC1/StrS family aminotransferase n=1 Tax=Tepidibacillus infernus TaxID=1806172 RepID=UPI003B6DC2CB